MTLEEVQLGQKVHYAPEHYAPENGIVKGKTAHAVFVVYNCGSDWEHYFDYTGANTNPRDLREGWTDEARNQFFCQ